MFSQHALIKEGITVYVILIIFLLTLIIIDEDYAALHKKRIKFIENYLKNYDYDIEDYRNAAIFLYYNVVIQVMEPSKALEVTDNLRKMKGK